MQMEILYGLKHLEEHIMTKVIPFNKLLMEDISLQERHGGLLQMEVDLDRAKAGRPKIVDLLKENGGRRGEDFR